MYKTDYLPGTALWEERRSQWLGMGITEEYMERPKIAVVNTANPELGCHGHLEEISQIVERAILDEGGLPFEIHVADKGTESVSARKQRKQGIQLRDRLTDEIIKLVDGAYLEGMICLSTDEQDTSAHLMAAARLNIPSMILSCGYQVGAACEDDGFDEQFFDIADAYDEIGPLAAGGISREELSYLPQASIITTGACSGLGTANSMQIIAEALGMCLPGSTPVWAKSKKLRQPAFRSGRQIVMLAENSLLPRDILTARAVENAVMVSLAVGASVSVVRQLAAIARAAGLSIDVMGLFEKYGNDIKLLTAVRPNGIFKTEDFDAAGGTAGVMARLGDS